ncbi:MAG TPA: hypothetical protein VKR29_08200 [Candidatus Binataceae bacterium]|nr:hypothetical protein [Candidatus Binataceae bacterium]
MKLLAAFILILTIFPTTNIRAGAWPIQEPVAAPESGRTEVITFAPAAPNAPVRDGYCWTQSIALPRAGAWRCMIGNAIEDPCFTTPETSSAVICGANPATGDAGFLMRLTKPLPAIVPTSTKQPSPWIVQLAVGQGPESGPYAMPPHKTYCSALTGTLPMVDGLALPYACWEANVESKPKLGDTQMGLLGDFNKTYAHVWTVTEISFIANPNTGKNQPPFKLTDRKTIALEKIWD